MHSIKIASFLLFAGLLTWSGCAKEELFTSDELAGTETAELFTGQGQGDQFSDQEVDLVSLEQMLKGPVPPGYVVQLIFGEMQINGDVIYQSPEPPIFRMWGDDDILNLGTAAYIESYYLGEGDSFFGGEGIITLINPDDGNSPAGISDRLSFYSIYKYSEEEEAGLMHYSRLLFYEGSGFFEGAYGAVTRKLHFTDPENHVGTINLVGYVLLPE